MSSHKGKAFTWTEKSTFWEHAVFQVFAKSTQVLSISIFSSPREISMSLIFSLVDFRKPLDFILKIVIRLERIANKDQVINLFYVSLNVEIKILQNIDQGLQV